MIALLLSSLLWAKHPCYGVAVTSPDYKEINKQIMVKVVSASQLVTIASEADSILSKLIAAQSPVLMNWLKKRDLLNAKEEVIAREWRQYYLDSFVLGQFPTKNRQINESVDSLFKDISQFVFDKKYKDKLNKIFGTVQKDALRTIESWNIEKKAKQQIVHKISSMKIYWFENLLGSRYENKPLEFIRWGVAYDPPKNEINIGVHTRKYPTDASLYAILAHEMGHAIDSCRWSAYFTGASPFENVYSCLRSNDSAGAKKRDDSKMDVALKEKALSKEMVNSLKLNPTCNRVHYPPQGTQKDQLPESFADWFSAEVYARSRYSNQLPRPDLCGKKDLMDGSSYLANRDRVDKIYLVQPLIAKNLKSSSKARYCELTTQSAQ